MSNRREYHRKYYRRNRKRILAGMKRRYMEQALKLVRLERRAA